MTTNARVSTSTSQSSVDWQIDSVVRALRKLRVRKGPAVRLPSRNTLSSIVSGLTSALFPNRLGLQSDVVNDDNVDFFVGQKLDTAMHELAIQVFRELAFKLGGELDRRTIQRRSHEIVGEFAATLPRIRELLETDLQAAYEGDPAASSADEVLACYPGMSAVTHYRLAHALYALDVPLVARMIAEIAHSTTGIDIHPGAQIQGSFFIDHGTGVVIGESAEIGERVRLYHGVTLGAKRFQVDGNGSLVKGVPRHPIVEDDVVIYAGATILGRITIGHGAVIGGNVWLTRSVPPGSVISQAQHRSESFDAGCGI